MAKKKSVAAVDQLLADIKKLAPEAAEALLRQLHGQVGPGNQTVEDLTGVSLTAKGGKVSVSDTTGKSTVIERENKIVFTPSMLPREHMAEADDAAAPEAPAPSSFLFLRLTASERSTVVLDSSNLYRSWARWGTMQLVVRTTAAAGTMTLSVVDKTSRTIDLAARQTAEIVGIGYAPRINPAAVFPALAFDKFKQGGNR